MTLTNDVQSGITKDITLATQNMQQALNTIPLANTIPQVKTFGPHYVVGGDPDAAVVFQFTGNFVDAIRGKGFTPQLVLCAAGSEPSGDVCRDSKVVYGDVETQALRFRIPASDFPKATDQRAPVTYLYLLAPYKKGLFHLARGTAVAREAVLSVPPTAGSVVVEGDTAPPSHTVTTVKTSQAGDSQQTFDDPAPQPGTDGPAYDEVVIPSSVQFHSENAQGQWTYTFTKLTPRPSVSVTTTDTAADGLDFRTGPCPTDPDVSEGDWDSRGKPTGQLAHICHIRSVVHGKVTWWLTYDVAKAVPEPQTLNLRWGDEKTFAIAPSRWHAGYVPFPAAAERLTLPLEIAQPECNDFLCFRVIGNNLTVSARALGDIAYPATFEGGAT